MNSDRENQLRLSKTKVEYKLVLEWAEKDPANTVYDEPALMIIKKCLAIKDLISLSPNNINLIKARGSQQQGLGEPDWNGHCKKVENIYHTWGVWKIYVSKLDCCLFVVQHWRIHLLVVLKLCLHYSRNLQSSAFQILLWLASVEWHNTGVFTVHGYDRSNTRTLYQNRSLKHF